MSDQVYGKWTVIGPGATSLFWKCKCECGTEAEVNKKNLKAGVSKQCLQCRGNLKKKHGMSGTPTYTSWQSMHDRCNNPNNVSYMNYGERGIKVCERWCGESGFANFLADMGERPSMDLCIDRENNDGNYEPGNCIWATRSQQQRNKRTTTQIPFDGRTQCAAEWAEEFGMSEKTFSTRRSRGWTMERIRDQAVAARRGSST